MSSVITKKAIPRRTVLRGIGVSLGLPILDAMFPAFSVVGKTAPKPAHRFQVVYVPNGMAMPYWSPTGEGTGFALSPILKPLDPFRNQLIVFSGLRANWVRSHAGASGAFLTGTTRGGRSETEILAETSMDQLLAKEFGRLTPLASLELSMDATSNAGECTSGLSCAYTHTISWRTPTMPLPMEHNPRAVFERLFGDSGSTEPSARAARLQEHKSILDSVTEQIAVLKRELAPSDQSKISDYSDAVRDVERRIQRTEEQNGLDLPIIDQPQGVPPVFEDHLHLMFDLQLLALRSDLTRVLTFMLGKEQSARVYPQIGVPDAHHPLSHHNNDPEWIVRMSKINTYHVELFTSYLEKLRATEDGDGSLLDHMTILYGAGISNSTFHAGDNLPVLLVGGGAGRLKGGRHLKYTEAPSMANLLVTLMDKLDVPVERIGGSTGKLPIDTLTGV